MVFDRLECCVGEISIALLNVVGFETCCDSELYAEALVVNGVAVVVPGETVPARVDGIDEVPSEKASFT